MTSSYAEFAEIGQLLASHSWIFAKTMPENPHEYTLRKRWQCDADFVRVAQYIRDHGYTADFVRVAQYIRDHGYTAYFRGHPYVQLDVNQFFYWTMGAPLDETILINRKPLQHQADYDAIAPRFDELFADADSQAENREVVSWLGDLVGKAVLDVGCGTGLLLDHASPTDYTGVDPSGAMLARLLAKHPYRRGQVACTPLRSFAGRQYDLVVALFGAASYLDDAELARVPELLAPGGRYLLMFYAPGYTPVTYRKTGIYLTPRYDLDGLAGDFRTWGNYWVVEGP